MLARLIAIAVSVVSMAAPTQAGLFLDQGHRSIIQAAQDAGLKYEVNPTDCPGDVDGFYTGDRLVVCQDRGTRGGPELQWSNNDLDTLRHEATHLVQDCKDGVIDMMLDAPSDTKVDEMIDRMGAERALYVWQRYHNRRLYMEGILVEIEAFHNARFTSAAQVAKEIKTYCPRVR